MAAEAKEAKKTFVEPSKVPQTDAEFAAVLESLRETGAPLEATSQELLHACLDFVMHAPKIGGEYHWFCSRVPPVLVEAATFNLRLFAFLESKDVARMRERLAYVLDGCCSCIQAFQAAKWSSRTTYFAAYEDRMLNDFWLHIDNWEVGVVSAHLKAIGTPSTSRAKLTLNSLPPPVVYHCVANPNILADPEIWAMLATFCPSTAISTWPPIPAPGLFLLLVHESSDVRAWAAAQLLKASELTNETLSEDHRIAISALASAVLPQHEQDAATTNAWKGCFHAGDNVLWSALLSVLESIPSFGLKHRVTSHNRVYHVVIGHLNDHGKHFDKVLQCFAVLLRKLGADLWTLEGEEFPQVVFSSVKDNPSFVTLLESSKDPWFFTWLEPFIVSVWDKSTFADIMAKIVSFMCEELQHERFKKWHPLIMTAMSKTLLAVMQKSSDPAHRKAIRSPFDIHAQSVVNVALSSSKSGESWTAARAATRSLLAHVLLTDVRDIEHKVQLLSSLANKEGNKSNVLPLTFGKSLWELTFRALRSDGVNANGIAFIVPVIAQCSLLNTLRPASYPYPKSKELHPWFKTALRDVNAALEYLHGSFEQVADDFTGGATTTKSLETMLGQSAIIYPMVSLLFSPAPTLRAAAQSIISYAYGNDGGRADCFRSLLERSSEVTLKALTRVNDTFSLWASSLSEACTLSQTLVLCLSDVLEVLCSRSGGLLFDKSFLYPASKVRPTRQITSLWASMCKALSVIFKRTPNWAAYYENKIMLEWMRDALIFGRDLLTYRSILESAVIAADEDSPAETLSSPRKLSSAGKQMVDELQVVLKEAINWLRLTDSELLYQSFNLLRSLFECFRKTDTKPADEPMQKLERFLDKARQRADSGEGDDTTRLSAVDLASLSEDMASFDDDVQIIEPPPRETLQFPNTDRGGKRAASPTDDLVSRKQPKTHAGSYASSKSLLSDTKSAKSSKQELAPIFKTSSSRPLQGSTSKSKPSTSSTPIITKSIPTQAAQQKGKPVPVPPRPVTAVEVPKAFTIGPSARSRDPAPTNAAGRLDKPLEISDGSSDEEEDNTGVAGLEKVQRSPPKIRKPEERRQVKMISMSGQEIRRQPRNILQDRTNKLDEARRISLRLKPDLTPLHRRILSWNYDSTSATPWVGDAPVLTAVPAVFRDHHQYLRVFEPLLLSECWSQLVKSKEEANIPVLTCSITGKGYVDDWIEFEILISEALPQKWFLAETDIVLLRHPADPTKKLLAKVHASMVSQRGNRELRATLRCTTNGDSGATVGTNWWLSRVLSLSTVHREFASLVALPYYDLFDDIVHARPARLTKYDTAEVQRAMSSHQVNEPQAKAILASMEAEGFLLIQGPPGTGKTSTICGIVGAFLSNRPKPATVIQVGRVAAPGKAQLRKKLLICAPSNAGIDEVAKRLREGVLDSTGQRVVPNIVRVGIDASVNASVKDLTLDFLVDQKLAGPGAATSKNDPKEDTNALHAELRTTKAALEQKYTEEQALQSRGLDLRAVKAEINTLKNKRLTLSKRLDDARDKQRADTRAADAARRKFRAEVLQEADVICSTLAGAGHDTLESFEFETVVIDEAAQSIELSSLIPLKYGCKRCIMVGDPQQLPPTVISPIATDHNYNQSLFVRIYNQRREAAHLLSIQYRMHPEISRIPSQLFYEGRLVDGPNMAQKTQQPWHASQVLGPYRFFNVANGNHESAAAGHSLINRAECEAALAIYELLLRDFRHIDMKYRIGVISMYKAQINALKKAFEARYGQERASTVDFNTVDGFQGQEKDIIILSCVRAGPGVTSIGFLSDFRRLNVSITRAKSSLFILGHAATLQRSDATWKKIVDDAKSRSALINVERNTFTSAAARPVASVIEAPVARTTTATPNRPVIAPSPVKEMPGLMTPQLLAKANTQQNAERARIPSAKRPTDNSPEANEPAAKRPRTSLTNEERNDAMSSKAGGSGTRQHDRGQQVASNGVNPPSSTRPPGPPKPRPKKAAPSLFIPKKKPPPG